MKKKDGGEKPHSFSQNTHLQFIESVPMSYLSLLLFQVVIKTHEKQTWPEERNLPSSFS